MKKIYSHLPLGLLLLALFSCKNETVSPIQESNAPNWVEANAKAMDNLNISFLLDLSDRIDPKKYPNASMEYYLRDVAYIKSVSHAFNLHMRQKKVRQMQDQIQVFFDPEPQNSDINSLSSSLKFSVDRSNASLDLLDEMEKTYANKPLELYELALKDNNFVGSDTWRFFKDKVKDYAISNRHRNILVIFTDGYIYHKNTKMAEGNKTTYLTPQLIRDSGLNKADWETRMEERQYGFLPATSGLGNLEVLVLGINPDPKNPYEKEVLLKYWKDWFAAMEVGRYEIKTADLPADLDKIIQAFILK